MRAFLFVAALLHVAFMVCELFPWPLPILLRLLSAKLPSGESFTGSQQKLVATIVHNAGVYNAIVAGGLFWAAWVSPSGTDVARVMLAGALVAGVFGTATLKSALTLVQAVVGIIGLYIV